MGTLNTNLYDRVATVENKHGFAVYRQISQMRDAVPENAGFVMNAELLQLAGIYGPKVRDLKSLYGFRIFPKKRNAEFKKIIGAPPRTSRAS